MIREEAAERIFQALDRDIRDRRGLKWEWEKIDEEVMARLKADWVEIIVGVLSEEADEIGDPE